MTLGMTAQLHALSGLNLGLKVLLLKKKKKTSLMSREAF